MKKTKRKIKNAIAIRYAKIIKALTGELPYIPGFTCTTELYLQIKLADAADEKSKYTRKLDGLYEILNDIGGPKIKTMKEIQMLDYVRNMQHMCFKKYCEAISEINKYSNALEALKENSEQIKVRFGRVYYNGSII